ncbi:MAG TPA: hypothetical protein VEC36_02860 [Patescibacteria group bacterium]|nr:hypothetical protein [Patescibacteria group bacterium]
MNILFTILVIFLCTNFTAQAQQDSPQRDNRTGLPTASAVPKELYSQSATFFKTLTLSNIDDAFDQLLQGSPIRDKKEQFQRLVDQTKRAFQLYGNAQGYERVSDEYVTESLMRLRYITMHDDLPMRWILTYYKSPKRGWIIINIKFDDEAEFFFED